MLSLCSLCISFYGCTFFIAPEIHHTLNKRIQEEVENNVPLTLAIELYCQIKREYPDNLTTLLSFMEGRMLEETKTQDTKKIYDDILSLNNVLFTKNANGKLLVQFEKPVYKTKVTKGKMLVEYKNKKYKFEFISHSLKKKIDKDSRQVITQ